MPRPEALTDPSAFATPDLYSPGHRTPSAPTAGRLLPLQGLTILAVEDSRYASDALRLMCQRSGARLRRAESILAARAHLRCYRPDLVIVDLGLPDGRGEDLIRSLAATGGAVVLGMSGDPDGRGSALAAGAVGFVDKPVASLSAFQALVSGLVSGPGYRTQPSASEDSPPAADLLALHDDLAHAAAILADEDGADRAGYVAGFVQGLARAAGDSALESAALAARAPAHGLPAGAAVDRLAQVLAARLQAPVGPLVAQGKPAM